MFRTKINCIFLFVASVLLLDVYEGCNSKILTIFVSWGLILRKISLFFFEKLNSLAGNVFVCVCVCVCVCVFMSIHLEDLSCMDQLDCQRTDQRCCVEDVENTCDKGSHVLKARRTLVKPWLCPLAVCEQDKVAS